MEVDTAPNRVRVFARVRPASVRQRTCVQTLEETRALRVCEGSSAQEFVFDGVFSQEARQEQVFTQVGLPVVRECLKGFNGSILAYGQTGSGKTHSLLHQGDSPGDSGLLPRVVSEIFNHVSQDQASVFEIEAAAAQVYNEQLDDLLHPNHKSGKGHNLVVESSGDVPGLTWLPCRDAAELSRTFSRARANLVYAETKMNKASSRSHAVFQIKITKHGVSDVTFSRLSIVDLAGSERVKKSGVDGMQFKEATAINKSLLAFGNVVSALVAKKRHVPFRDSKLTHILSPCIGNNCKTSLLVCTSPAEEHEGETLCSLEFASRAMRIEVNARVNRMVHLDSEAVAATGVVAHQRNDAMMITPEDELANIKQALAEAGVRGEEAQAQVAVANEAKLRAVERAEQAEARALIAEHDVAEWKARFNAASSEILSIKAASEVSESRALSAERETKEWKCKCAEATQRVDSLELLLQEAAREKQLRGTQLCVASAELEKIKGKHLESDLYKQEAAAANEAARLAAKRASHSEVESQKAKVETAAAKAEQARALQEAQRLAFERAQFESSQAAWHDACDAEEQRFAKVRKSLADQQKDLTHRADLLQGLEMERQMERQEVSKMRKQLEEERQSLEFDRRRIRNSVLGKAPPIKSFSEKPVSLSKMLAVDRDEKVKSHGNLRSSSETNIRKSPSLQSSGETQLRRSPSGSMLAFSEEAQANSYIARSRTPSRPRVRGTA